MNVIIHFKDGYELDHLAIPIELIEFIEKFCKDKNINLLPYQKEVIKQISQAIKEGKVIKIRVVRDSRYLEFKKMFIKYLEEEMKEVND